ncbi:hypothetical protein [Endomicrobium proavitum]|uniref:hypothetical protein n=1 Tax=Endomicrobium proavitum TaxID=1408281 RepID=UPI000697935E|nr:hypothetical protein [Endomicrobium proavitum]
MGNKNCSCPHCSSELKNGCFSPKFCKPCGVKSNVKICPDCQAEYLAEYDKCPSCAAAKLKNKE